MAADKLKREEERHTGTLQRLEAAEKRVEGAKAYIRSLIGHKCTSDMFSTCERCQAAKRFVDG